MDSASDIWDSQHWSKLCSLSGKDHQLPTKAGPPSLHFISTHSLFLTSPQSHPAVWVGLDLETASRCVWWQRTAFGWTTGTKRCGCLSFDAKSANPLWVHMVHPSVQLCLDPQLSPAKLASLLTSSPCSASSTWSKSKHARSQMTFTVIGYLRPSFPLYFTMAQWENTLQIQLSARNSFIKRSAEPPHLIHAAYAAQDSALIQHAATNRPNLLLTNMQKCLAADASMTLSLASQGITVFPLPDAFCSISQDAEQSIMGWGGKRGSKELQDISSPSKKHQDNSLAPSHSTEKLATIPTATGTGAGWIFVRVLACVGWSWLGFFAFRQINLEMECRGASFIVAQLEKCWFAVFVRV